MSSQPEPSAPARKTRVLILFGGRSGEHVISCATAGGVMRAIDRERYEVVPVGITRAGQWVLAADEPERWEITPGNLPEVTATGGEVLLPLAVGQRVLRVLEPGEFPRELGEVDVVFPLLHGPFGEDGTLQGLLELADVPYVGAGVLASAVGMDKQFMKLVLAGQGLPIAPYTVIPPGEWDRNPAAWTETVAGLGLPVFVKPARAGSSLGITKVDDLADLPAAIAEARRHDPKVVIEAGVVGREIECAVLGGREGERPRASLPGEIVVTDAHHDFYDFEAKYLDEAGVELSCPADLPQDLVDEVRDIAVRTFEAVGAEGLSRVDVFVTTAGQVIVNEINTMPGFTPFSMYPRMWEKSGITYPELIDELIQLALQRPTGLR
ncbi:D-alanine--D-alanine ligase [Oerskovia turbata]|uniref:D-alanine--D-alanine ligase n=1 Tax=Oerskovia turbata TaxID=1713 RepID=A0A4Q1L1Y9_9CELL|nr:D-alanine--D-alanine ligase family protein [Oerskovia turbata]RXR28052.1 D-alanine--D-alanine ligase [Oerskovia turbata]RXR35939.1 D-alanine--D-alanine ligase [Oerskovia turbata]TGJ94852.1 D-alanine--D-alanine ligase A [Actinotalea fermentans ATCC 43279 = JCM 9966 = DSM 3133]